MPLYKEVVGRRYKDLVKLIVLGKKRNIYFELFYDKELIKVKTVKQPRYRKLNSLSRPQCLLNDLFISRSERHKEK